jgi:hypothetical protein
MISYGLLLVDPAWAALLAWMVSMVARQSGHFFFEPLGYAAHMNEATSRVQRESGDWVPTCVAKWCCWVFGYCCPWSSTIFQGNLMSLPTYENMIEFLHAVGYSWLFLGVGGLLSYDSLVLHQRCSNGFGVDDQNLDRSIP